MSSPTVIELWRALGRAGSREVIEAFVARGEPALVELLAARLHPPPATEAEPAPDGRAVVEALEECVGRLARAHPDAFVHAVEREPALLEVFDVLAAAAHLEQARTTEWLLAALQHRRGTHRWLALRALIERREPRMIPHLRALGRDRDGAVALRAVGGLSRWGTSEDLDLLLERLDRVPLGTRELALDAIERICAREGRELPSAHPGARLVEARVPHDASVLVTPARLVRPGDAIARAGERTFEAPVEAPVEAVVSTIEEHDDGWRVVLRRVSLAR